jgi:hypothetical protein
MPKQKKDSVPDFYEEDINISNVVKELVQKDFSFLDTANIGVLVKHSEKPVSNNPSKLLLMSPIHRYFCGLDFILIVENNILRELSPEQLEHLIFRTLAHADMTEVGEYKLTRPDYSFFRKEITKFGEEGLLDIAEIIKTVRDRVKKKQPDNDVVEAFGSASDGDGDEI